MDQPERGSEGQQGREMMTDPCIVPCRTPFSYHASGLQVEEEGHPCTPILACKEASRQEEQGSQTSATERRDQTRRTFSPYGLKHAHPQQPPAMSSLQKRLGLVSRQEEMGGRADSTLLRPLP